MKWLANVHDDAASASHSVMAKVPEEEQCKCPPEKHNAANPATSFIQGLYK
jgi:hypothetical protein